MHDGSQTLLPRTTWQPISAALSQPATFVEYPGVALRDPRRRNSSYLSRSSCVTIVRTRAKSRLGISDGYCPLAQHILDGNHIGSLLACTNTDPLICCPYGNEQATSPKNLSTSLTVATLPVPTFHTSRPHSAIASRAHIIPGQTFMPARLAPHHTSQTMGLSAIPHLLTGSPCPHHMSHS